MKKGTIVRYSIVKYHDVGGGHLFPRDVDNRLMRHKTAHEELRKIQASDFANEALYGLARWVLPADDLHGPFTKHKVIEA